MDKKDVKNVCVGVSGGMDSAATVLMLKEQGYNVVGVTFAVEKEKENRPTLELQQRLGIEIELINIHQEFENKIIEPFIESYLKGETPSPCVECNSTIKWNTIMGYAQKREFSNWATGHYCSTTQQDGFYYIKKGVDPVKDQSYYLWKLNQQTIQGAVMPLGGYTKSEIREFLQERGHTGLSEKKESMGVCFLGSGGYKSLLKERVPSISTLNGGEIVTKEGEIIGFHEGYPFYTLAQKKGLQLPPNMCVTQIDVNKNRLIVSHKDDLFTSNFTIHNSNIINPEEFYNSSNIEVKVRGVGVNPDGFCKIIPSKNGKINISLQDDRAWAVAEGQPAVFYIGDRVVGGGYICK